MKKQALYFSISLLAFNIALISTAIFSFESNELERSTNHKQIRKLIFTAESANACGMDFSTGIAYRSIKSSDGENLLFSMRDFKSEKIANDWIKSELEKADKIIESEFLLDEKGIKLGRKIIFESDEKGFILEYWNGSKNYGSHSINLLEAPTLQHVIAYDKSQTQIALNKDTNSDELFNEIK